MLGYLIEADPGSDDIWRKAFEEFACTLNWEIVFIEKTPVAGIALGDFYGVASLDAICVLQDYQNRGIGSEILQQLFRWSHLFNRPVFLEVLKINIRAQQLYKRCDFRTIGESPQHLHMIWVPPGNSIAWRLWIILFRFWLKNLPTRRRRNRRAERILSDLRKSQTDASCKQNQPSNLTPPNP